MSCSFDPSHYARSAAHLRQITRRQFFSDCGIGVGKMCRLYRHVLSSLLRRFQSICLPPRF